jgi:hypothetical protein
MTAISGQIPLPILIALPRLVDAAQVATLVVLALVVMLEAIEANDDETDGTILSVSF